VGWGLGQNTELAMTAVKIRDMKSRSIQKNKSLVYLREIKLTISNDLPHGKHAWNPLHVIEGTYFLHYFKILFVFALTRFQKIWQQLHPHYTI
jgi:hypothetical protein